MNPSNPYVQAPLWLRLLSVTRAAVVEETAFRGYGLSRIQELTAAIFGGGGHMVSVYHRPLDFRGLGTGRHRRVPWTRADLALRLPAKSMGKHHCSLVDGWRGVYPAPVNCPAPLALFRVASLRLDTSVELEIIFEVAP